MKNQPKERTTFASTTLTTLLTSSTQVITTTNSEIVTALTPNLSTEQSFKKSDVGLIAGATIVGTLFLLVTSTVIYFCCCRNCRKTYPRKNSTYQMYSEVDASQYVVPGNLRTINSPIYGREDQDNIRSSEDYNFPVYSIQNGNVYEEIKDDFDRNSSHNAENG